MINLSLFDIGQQQPATRNDQDDYDRPALAASHYPAIAGHQRTETSAAAAEAIERKGRAANLREKCLDLLKAEALTADECAELLGENPLSIRPRVSELSKQGLLMDTGERRPSSMGSPMVVWEVKRENA
jgi:predicted HTH transcriptional regulator